MGFRVKPSPRTNRPLLWTVGGAFVALLALGGLRALAPIHYEPPQPKFFIALLLSLAFEIGLVTFIISINCWLNFLLTPTPESSVAQTNHFVLAPGGNTADSAQFARSVV